MPTTHHTPLLWQGFLWFLCCVMCPSSATAFTHFLDKNAKGEISTAHWPDERLPLLLSIDKEDFFKVEGKTAIQVAKEAAILWKQVPGCRMRVQVEQINKDIDSANFTKEVKLGDKRHEIVIEHDGKILQQLGLDPDFIVAIGIPVTEMNPTGALRGPFGGKIVDAFVVINTKQTWSLARFQRILTHELGHILGLGHTNVTYLQHFEELPVMFYDPLQQPGAALLHPDDSAGLASLYPANDFETRFGAISGRIMRADGTPVFGAAVFATNDKLGPIGVWTDADGRYQVTGLMPGTYGILARAIDGSKEVKSMKPSSHIGGLISQATTEFCPERYNDQVFNNCRFPVSVFWKLQVRASKTVNNVDIRERRNNPTGEPTCAIGSAPLLPLRPHGLPPLAIGQRGAVCPAPPEPPPSEEPPTPDIPDSLNEAPDVVQRPEGPQDTTEMPVCGCQQQQLPLQLFLCLFCFGLISRKP